MTATYDRESASKEIREGHRRAGLAYRDDCRHRLANYGFDPDDHVAWLTVLGLPMIEAADDARLVLIGSLR